MGKKELQVAAIENGTVIDHIPADKTYQVVRLLNLHNLDAQVTIGYNLPSKKIGKKGIIKIADKFFTNEEISRLSVIAPKIILNTIKNYEVVEKKTVETPDALHGIIKCNNPKCITNNEPMPTYFTIVDKSLGIVKCHYCDMEQDIEQVELA
jgi:hypothetical protein